MSNAALASPKDFEDDPRGWASRWGVEFSSARQVVEKWHTLCEEIIKWYLDERDNAETERLNLFTASVNTRLAMLYGKTPSVDVDRRNNDSADDAARVAAEMLQRTLNADIEGEQALTLEECIGDFLRVGMAMTKLRYVREAEETEAVPATDLAPEVPAGEKLLNEAVEADYIYWKDHLWSPARVYAQVRWWAFKNELTQPDFEEKFGEDVAAKVSATIRKQESVDGLPDPWKRVIPWEIWDKEHKCVWWYVEGHDEVLIPLKAQATANANGSIPDPLGIKGFWPFPRPLMANLTTTSFVPRPDFKLAKDQYRAINETTTRIGYLREAIKAAGIYDGSMTEIAKLMKVKGNILVPVKQYAAVMEKGGVAACIQWMPLDQVVAALDKLRELRTEEIGLVFQVTGDSDIMRGQATAGGATATEQAIKAKFASVRMQRTQDEVARYASDLQRISGEIMANHFAPETLIERSNVKSMSQGDQALVGQAVQVLQSEFAAYRIAVKPEAISLTDYAALKQERTEIIAAIGGYLQVAGPLAAGPGGPAIAPFLLQILQWMIAGLKGGASLEGVLDEAVKAAQEAAAQPRPPQQDPKAQAQLQVAQVRAQAEMGKAHADQQKTGMDMQVAREKHGMDMQKLQADATVQQMEMAARREGAAAMATVGKPA